MLPSQALTEGAAAILWIPAILAGAQVRSGPLCWRPCIFLGNLSYGLYLLHFPIADYASAADRHLLHLFGAAHQWLLAAGTFCTSMIASVGLYLFVEVPMRRRILALAAAKSAVKMPPARQAA